MPNKNSAVAKVRLVAARDVRSALLAVPANDRLAVLFAGLVAATGNKAAAKLQAFVDSIFKGSDDARAAAVMNDLVAQLKLPPEKAKPTTKAKAKSNG